MKLPKPDAFGTYWLGADCQPPAIMRSKRKIRTRSDGIDIIDQGHFFATTAAGPITDGRSLKTFATPLEAFKAIQEG